MNLNFSRGQLTFSHEEKMHVLNNFHQMFQSGLNPVLISDKVENHIMDHQYSF